MRLDATTESTAPAEQTPIQDVDIYAIQDS